jgi:hypothetical protein
LILADTGAVIARLAPGQSVTQPEVVVLSPVSPGVRLRLHRRLVSWTRDAVASLHAPWTLSDGVPRAPEVVGLLYQLQLGLGSVRVRDLTVAPTTLSEAERAYLKGLGLVVGHAVVYALANLKPERLILRAGLCTGFLGRGLVDSDFTPGTPSVAPHPDVPPSLYNGMGYPVFGPRAVFAPVAETLASGRRPRHRALVSQLGCSDAEAEAVWEAVSAPRIATVT